VLHVVGTPIGNLEDITLRALRVLGEVSLIAAEDTRVTRKLLARHGIRTPLVSFREQNASHAIPELLAHLAAGRSVALVSDAGTPSISDPGQTLVAAALAAGLLVAAVPGPSALTTAVSVAGLRGDGLRFAGFPPRKGRERARVLERIAADRAVTVLYEAPGRLAATLRDLAAFCGPEREAVVCRELTKLHEEVARGTLADIAERFAAGARGEVTLVVSGATAARDAGADIDDGELRRMIATGLASGKSARDLAADLSAALGLPRRRIYTLAVEEVGSGRIP
jgi:16S rRNA (cytidine1402-2'-O)-methyltransferase